MDNIRKTMVSLNQEPLASRDAVRKPAKVETDKKKGQAFIGRQKNVVRENGAKTSLVDTLDKKRLRQDDFIENGSRPVKKNYREIGYKQTSKEVMERIRKPEFCSEAYDSAISRNVPEIFVDKKDKGKRTLMLGMNVVSDWIEDTALASFGQIRPPPASWGRIFIAIPSLQRIEVLENFSSVIEDDNAMHFFCKINLISDLDTRKTSPNSEMYSAPARLDLMFRFGVFKCINNIEVAEEMKSLIPDHKMRDAYSYALQSAVLFNKTDMMRYCLDNGASPISPEEVDVDSREFSPIELAFAVGTIETQKLLIDNVSKDRDLSSLKQLFLDSERWQSLPPQIVELFKKLG